MCRSASGPLRTGKFWEYAAELEKAVSVTDYLVWGGFPG